MTEQAEESIWAPIRQRLFHPLRQVTFWLVLLLGIVVVGYLAVWIEVGHVISFTPTSERSTVDLDPLRLAYATAILATASPCLMQLLLTDSKMIRVAAIALAFAALWLAYCVSVEAAWACRVHVYGGLGMALAILAWWLANGEDPLLQDRVSPSASSGGDNPLRDLPGGETDVRT